MSKKLDLNRLRHSIECGMQEIQQLRILSPQRIMCLQNGNHIVRLFADPNGEYYFKSPHYHKIGQAKTLCRGRKCEICNLFKATKNWKLKKRQMVIFFMAVIRTSIHDGNWRIGAVGPVLVRKKLGDAVIRFIKSLADSDAALVSNWFDPSQNGVLFELTDHSVVGHTIDGHIQDSQPVTLGDWHKPLEEVWPIPDTDASYFTVLAEAQAEADKYADNWPEKPA